MLAILRPVLPQLRNLCARSISYKLPTSIATKALVQLPRSVIAIYGRDSPKYLNGLITIRPPEPRPDMGKPQAGAYAAILNAKGRVVSDLFVFAAHDNAEVQSETGADNAFCYLLEIDSKLVPRVVDMLEFHVLTSDVKIKVLDNYKVWSAWNDIEEVDTTRFGENSFWINDMRAPGLGYRVISKDIKATRRELTPVAEYNLRRYLCGVPEGPGEIIAGRTLPLDACIDYMGGIDFNKGCYLGQELTIRTHHHGTVRKRIVPVVLTHSHDEEIPEDIYKPEMFNIVYGTNIFDANPVPNESMISPIFGESPFKSSTSSEFTRRLKPSGAMICAMGNVGLALLRIDKIGHDFEMEDYCIKALTPYWWPESDVRAEE